MGVGEFAERLPGIAHGLRHVGYDRQHLLTDGSGQVAYGGFSLLDFLRGGIHARLKLFLHRACRLAFVGNECQGLIKGFQAADGKADVVAVFLAKQLGQGDGALLLVQFLQASQEITQRSIRVVLDVLGQCLARQTEVFQPFGKGFDTFAAGLQAVEHGIDSRACHFRGFAKRDKGSRQGGGLFAGQPELLGATTDAQQRLGDFVFGRGSVVA